VILDIKKEKKMTNPTTRYYRDNRSKLLPLAMCVVFIFLSGCGQHTDISQARNYVVKSRSYYERAVHFYKRLLAGNKNQDILYFELGKVYYDHGDFSNAIEQFKKTRAAEAKKYIAISYFRLGNFIDALGIFDKDGGFDDESRYFYGLTCEKMNLYDLALSVYRKIHQPQFASLAGERVNLIEKQSSQVLISALAPEVNTIIAQAPASDAYPQAGALILSCDEKIEITRSDTQVSSMHYIVKILNERGKKDFSETQIDYDSTYEKVELEYARTIKPDGTVVDVGSRHIRDVSKYMNFPLYSNARVYIISFPEITENAVVEYKLRIYRNQLINKKDFVMSYPVQSSEPIISAQFSLQLPETKPLHIKTLNAEYNTFKAELAPLVRKEDGMVMYRWQFSAIPQIIPEANMPAFVQITPVLLFSSFDSWQDIYAWWWQLARDKIKADAAIQAKVKELTGQLASEEEKIRALYNFCAQKIRYVAVEYGQAGYEPHQAGDIFKNKYGDCKDQAILLVTMLRQAGLSAYPVLIATKEYFNLNPDFPSVMFNHCIAAVLFKERVVFLDPTAETCSFDDLPGLDQNRRVLLCADDKYEIHTTPLYPARHNLVRQGVTITLHNDESIYSKKSVVTSGAYDQAQRYWLLYTPPQLISESLQEKIQEISIGAKLLDYSIENLNDLNQPVVLKYEFNGSEYLTAAGSLRIIPQLAGVDNSLVAKEKRDFPIDFTILDSRETEFTIEFPDNFSVKYMPDNVVEDSKWLKFTALYQRQDNKINFKQTVELKENTVPTEQYSEFKNFFEGLAKKLKQRIVLEKIQ
jgi:transglutaminase-like putative cysteine protease/tetratricopeptide (TPR) repeat protein